MVEPWEILWWFLIAYTTFIRIKYVWQGNKIRKLKSARDVSHKFMLYTHVAYWIEFAHNLNVADVKDQLFWGIGILTTAYCIFTMWQYREPKVGLKQWLKEGLSGAAEGGVWR